MREAILPKLRCPACHAQPLALHDAQTTAQEIRVGQLTCPKCGQHYSILDGVVELFAPLDSATQRERDARNLKQRDWVIESQRPFVNDMPQTPWVWPSFATNVQQGLTHLPLAGAWVLDLGAATGWSTRMLCERGAQALALDISTGMLVDAEAQFATGVYFDRLAATMNNLPFIDGVFDAIFASATIHHSPDVDHTLREIARVLKVGGHLVLVNEPVLGLLRSAKHFGQSEIEQGMNEHIYRLADYIHAARQAGLQFQIVFPEALRQQLAGQIPMPPTLPLRVMRQLWPWLPAFVQDGSLFPGHWLIGLDLTLIAHKPSR